jgi:plastocyanin
MHDDNKRKTIKVRTILIIVAIVAVLGVGGVVGYKKFTSPRTYVYKSDRRPLPKVVTVSATKTGFSPEIVNIKRGVAVRWVNNSGGKVSVNSDDYPTNRLYPELNLGELPAKSALVHVFKNPGTFTYHSQFNPKASGQITVE